jgi:hypothetical protein
LNFVKRILFYVLIAAALGGAVWAYFHLKNTKQPSLKAVNVLPDSAICILSGHNFTELANKLGNQNLIWNELVGIKEIASLNKQIQYYDSIIGENDMLNDFFKDHAVYLALYNTEKGLEHLITFNLKDLAQQPEFTDAITKAIKGAVKSDYGIEFRNGETKYYVRIQQGVFALSNTITQIENAFASQSKKATKNKTVESLLELNKEDELLNIYVNHDLLKACRKQIGIQSQEFILSGHSVGNVEIFPDEISMNGFNKPDPSSLLNALSNQQPQSCDFLNALPYNTVSFKALGISDFNFLRSELKIDTEEANAFWKIINDSALYNAEKEFYDNIDTKLIEVELSQNSNLTKALLVEVKDTAKSLELMKVFSDSLTIQQNVKLAKLDSICIRLVKASFGNAFAVKPAYAFIFGKYFILTENKEGALAYINSLHTNFVLSQNESFSAYAKENLGLAFNYVYYSALNKNKEKLKNIFNFIDDEAAKRLDRLNDFYISVANYKSLLQFRINLRYQQLHQNKETPSLWTFEADTIIQSQPWAFSNHKTGENELIVQDAKNNLYLLNATGALIWKKQINESVISDVYTVDAFKNNKYQLLFNSQNYLHLIDRNGNYLDGFPVKLPSAATNKLTVLDYDGKKDYRLFLACADNKIYNFNCNGTKNDGFTTVKTQEAVALPIKYVNVGASDYLLAVDAEGQIYVFSRRGEMRINLRNRLIGGCNDFFVDAGSNLKETKIIYLDDKSSLLNKISLEDKKETVKLGNDFEEARVGFDLIDDDKKTDILIASKTGAYVFDLNGNRLFSYVEENTGFKNLTFQMDVDNTIFLANNEVGKEIELVSPLTAKLKNKYPATKDPLVMDLFRDGKKYILLVNGMNLGCVMLN